jgi:hypothetical protein
VCLFLFSGGGAGVFVPAIYQLMSNKKRRNRKEDSDAPELNSSTVTPNRTKTTDEAVPNQRGLFAYLKTHLWLVGLICFLTLGVLGAGLKYLDDEAQREIARRANQKGKLNNESESFLNKINPFLPNPSPTPTPTPLSLSKSYVYAGSRLLAVEDANANATPPSDLAIWRPSSGEWWVMAGTGTQQATQAWGASGDVPVPGDYDGDGKTDFAVFRPSNSNWYQVYSSTGATNQFSFGTLGDQAVPADYDGDGKTDVAVFRNSNSTWYISQSSNSTTVYGTFGVSGDTPAPADYDGDGKADLAIFRGGSSAFYSLNSSNLQTQSTSFGASGDKPVPADYDGDGKADIAMWRKSNATWYFKYSSDNSTPSVQFGIEDDTPVPNDYDGDAKVDIAIWRGVSSTSPGNDVGRWRIRPSSNPSTTRVEWWGIAGDVPVPAFWKR